jgi:large subunit ribosomal protein L25
LYGGETQTSFTATEKELKKIIWSPEVYEVKLTIDGKEVSSIIQDLQFHPVTDRVTHVDFLQVIPGKEVKLKLPLKLTGAPEGVKKGGKLLQNFRKLTVRGDISKMPANISLACDHLDIGSDIRIKDMKIDGLTFLEEPNAVVAAVKITRNVVEEPKAAAASAAAAAPAAAAAKAPAKK